MYLPLDVCIYIMYIYQMQAMYNTCCFPSPSATQPSSFLSPPGRPQADGSPLMCRGSASGSFLTNRVFSCPCCHCACTKGVQALGSVKSLETIVLLWRNINKIELN